MSEETQVTQETSNLDATPAQDTTVTTPETTQPSKPETATTEAENWEYNGDRKAVPTPFQKYVAGLDRYVSKKDQSRMELEKKVKEYETKLASIQTNPKESTGDSTSATPSVTPDEAEAIMLGDVNTLQKVIQREAKKVMESDISPKEAAINQKLTAMETRQKEIDASELIKSFTDVNPDFNELLKSPVGEFMVEAARKGAGIEDIYKQATAIRDHFLSVAESKRKTELEKKKNGSVVGKSIAGNPDTIFADDENHAKRLAIELNLKGDNRRVQVKDRKK